MNNALNKYQQLIKNLPRPGEYHELLKVERLVLRLFPDIYCNANFFTWWCATSELNTTIISEINKPRANAGSIDGIFSSKLLWLAQVSMK